MVKRLICCICAVVFIFMASGCSDSKDTAKIGVSFGVGGASRWVQEKEYMENRAKELGAQIEVRINTTDTPKTQTQDCFEMIDSGIDVLILTPRDIKNVKEIIDYAKKNRVKVISYARVAMEQNVDLFVGYDCGRMGQNLGQYLAEMVDHGNYILIKGDPGDPNAVLLYDGAMRYISPIKENIHIALDTSVPNWSANHAKKMVYDAVKANGNKVDAILAPNDKIAEACVQALEELGVTNHVVITGMDAELNAAKRIVAGKQDVTIYMDLKELASTAIDEAYHMAKKQPVNINAKFDNQTHGGIDANLITGKLITKQNLDKVLIQSGYFTKEEVYGTE